MKAKKDPKIFLKHILESIGEIEKNTKNLSDFFQKQTSGNFLEENCRYARRTYS